jgi:hypothetical protein
VVELHKGVLGPQLFPEFFASDNFTGALGEQGEDLEGLLLKLDARAAFAQLAGGEVQLEDAEADYLCMWGVRHAHPRLLIRWIDRLSTATVRRKYSSTSHHDSFSSR